MKNYWIITERGSNLDSLFNNGFRASTDFTLVVSERAHIYLDKRKIFSFQNHEVADGYDISIKDFDINKYNKLSLLVSLGIPTEEALKEIE